MVLYNNMVEHVQEVVDWELQYHDVDPFGYLWNLIPDELALLRADRGSILIKKDFGRWVRYPNGDRRLPPTIDVGLYDKRGLRRLEAFFMTPDGVVGEIHDETISKSRVGGIRLDTLVSDDFHDANRIRYERMKDVARYVKKHAIISPKIPRTETSI